VKIVCPDCHGLGLKDHSAEDPCEQCLGSGWLCDRCQEPPDACKCDPAAEARSMLKVALTLIRRAARSGSLPRNAAFEAEHGADWIKSAIRLAEPARGKGGGQ
jgi:hypothetical protein